MQAISGPSGEIGGSENTFRCADCDASVEVTDDGEQPVEGLLRRSGRPSHRVVMVDGVEVHRCLSPFLIMVS
jgi:hypothetical protein